MPIRPDLVEDFEGAVAPVSEWVASLTGLDVVHDWDEAHDGAATVVLRPMSLALAPAAGPVRAHVSSAELTLTLLVSVAGAPVRDAAAIVTALALAAGIDGPCPVGDETVDAATWLSLGRPPAPAFTLRVPVRRLVERAAPLVREPLRLDLVRTRSVEGRLVWPDGRPVPSARVRLASGGDRAVATDHRGRFRLTIAVVGDGPIALSVASRGTTAHLAVDLPPEGAAADLGDLTIPVPESV